MNSPDQLQKELRRRRWPLYAAFAFLLFDVVFAMAFRVPDFANGSAVGGAGGRVLAVFPDAQRSAPRPEQPATLTGPQGTSTPLQVVRVRRVTAESGRKDLGLPSTVTVPFLVVELSGAPTGSAERDRPVGQVRVRVAEYSLLSTLTGSRGGA